MKKIVSIASAGLMSVVLGLTAMPAAQAMPLIKTAPHQVSDAEPVQYRRVQRGARKWRGHRGYRHQRRGYRRHSDGWWYPLAAFSAGAIIGGAIASQPRVSGNSHVEWCYDRYRSYRASDDTFQPYNGPRQQCRSPY